MPVGRRRPGGRLAGAGCGDLARATGQDETLDPEEVHRQLEAVLPYDEALRSSGHYGPRVEVPDDADEQTKLLAFIGRTP